MPCSHSEPQLTDGDLFSNDVSYSPVAHDSLPQCAQYAVPASGRASPAVTVETDCDGALSPMTCRVRFRWPFDSSHSVAVRGSWDNWTTSVYLSHVLRFEENENSTHSCKPLSCELVGAGFIGEIILPARFMYQGFQYKYIVDGEWRYNGQEPTITVDINGTRATNNIRLPYYSCIEDSCLSSHACLSCELSENGVFCDTAKEARPLRSILKNRL